MICVTDLQKDIRHGLNDKAFVKLYGTEKAIITLQKNRYVSAMQAFSDLFGKNREVSVYSTPGRTELAGNHTDHNLGIAVAGTVQADIIAIVSKNNENIIRVRSRGYDKTITVDLAQLEINENETGRSPALVRGIAAGIAHFNGKIGGFDVYTNSFILKGSGLSSSAAFEICLANIFNCEFNGGNLGLIKIAKIAQWAENVYYGKESGLLDALACSFGGIVKVDLQDENAPKIKRLKENEMCKAYKLYITDTQGTHGNQIKEVSEICLDMKKVAQFFYKNFLRQVNEKDFYARLPEIREKLGDRAVLRSIHFYEECKRAEKVFLALKNNNAEQFLKEIIDCGNSSFEYNQNAYSIYKPNVQGISIALAISQKILEGRGAWRLQGSGFSGTIQAFVPNELATLYKNKMDRVFGKNACNELKVRNVGSVKVF